MIELRYVKTKIETKIGNESCVIWFENVLQFRTMQNLEEVGIYAPIWGVWQAVPIVDKMEAVQQ